MGIADQIWRPIVPDFNIWRSRLNVGSELLPQIAAGRVTVHADVAQVEGSQVIFEDGTRTQVDTITRLLCFAISGSICYRAYLWLVDLHIVSD